MGSVRAAFFEHQPALQQEEVQEQAQSHVVGPALQAAAYLDGLLDDAERKNSWQLAEMACDATPYSLQYLLGRAVWSDDAAEHRGDPGSIVVVD